MPRGAIRTVQENEYISNIITNLFNSQGQDYDDAAAAAVILKEHHIDMNRQAVMLFRLKMGLRKRGFSVRTNGHVRTTTNTDSAEGFLAMATQHINNAAIAFEQGSKEITAAFDVMGKIEAKLRERPYVSPEERQALNILRRRT